VLVLLLVLVLENSRYLAVTLIERNSAGIFGPSFGAESQRAAHEHDSLSSESGFKGSLVPARGSAIERAARLHYTLQWSRDPQLRL
jgi:hypothetical protein